MCQKKHTMSACRAHSKDNKKGPGLKILNVGIWIAVAVMILSYAAFMNNLTVKGFNLKDLKSQARTLKVENQEVKSKITELESYKRISKKVEELDMVAVAQIDYIVPPQNVIAKK